MPEQGAGSWFRCWKAKNGKQLSDIQVTPLTALIMNLEYSAEEIIRMWRTWAIDLTAFWGRSFSTKTEFLRHVLDSEGDP
ncbi:hypothetical protein BJX68DRAFT_244716 [Aspergillus pseudodeflectus]|uniref:Uncharacterized protein n=1 Tax=Aspergillus pseudodeflectus TaxID=176178 RepID=A0ABR4JR06_9EURO